MNERHWHLSLVKTLVAGNKFLHVKVARNTKKVEQACCKAKSTINLAVIYIKNLIVQKNKYNQKLTK